MNWKCILVLAAVLAAPMVLLSDEKPSLVSLEGEKMEIYRHIQGADGKVVRTADGWTIHYDFSKGGFGVGLMATPAEPIWPRSIRFDATCDKGHTMGLLVVDSAGQRFLTYLPLEEPGVRKTYVIDQTEWRYAWGGPVNSIVRAVNYPITSVAVHVDRITRGIASPEEVGDVPVWNFAYEPMNADEIAEARRRVEQIKHAEAAPPAAVRYLVTDFTPGDRFSGAPRAFHRGWNENADRSMADGRVDVDFARETDVRLINEVPVWGVPKEFLLTVDAPVGAAGTEFQLGVRVGGKMVFNSFGKLRKAEAGEERIVQTFSMPGPVNSLGWDPNAKGAVPLGKSKRVMQVRILKGDAPAEKFTIRLARLEAVTVAALGHEAPLLGEPPTGSEPPRTLVVDYLNILPTERKNAEIRVAVTDWEKRSLGEARAAVPTVAPGGRTRVVVSLPSVPAGLNFVSYDCTLWQDGKKVAEVPHWDVSWTRPLADAGTPALRPDLPWGIGVYLYRTGKTLSFASAYSSPTYEGWKEHAEQRAAMAQAAGLKWERLEFNPSRISRKDGTYDFSFTDTLLDIAEKHGLTCFGCFSHFWPQGSTPYTQEAYDRWAEALRRAVLRYKGRIRYWEIWNEPNIGFWTGPKEDYPKLVTAAYRAVREADPDAVIVACSTAGADFGFIDMCRKNGMEYHEISFHNYPTDPEERRFCAELEALVARAHGHPVWMSEIGWPTGCGNNTYSEREQAGKYARAYMTAAASGNMHAIFGYNFVDDGFCALERENNFGIVRRDMTPKPAYRGLAKVCRTFTEGKASMETVNLAGKTVFVFRMGGKAAIWADKPVHLTVCTAKPAVVTNLMDEELSRGRTETAVEVGPLAPVFFDSDVMSVKGM